MKPILNVIRPLPPTASAFSTAMMKKSSSFSFSSLAAAAATGNNNNKNPPPATIDLAKLTSQLKGTTKKSTDDSFRRWEEQRAKKLEALNINTKTLKRKTKVEEKQQQQQQTPTQAQQPKKEEKPQSQPQQLSRQLQQQQERQERPPIVVKYNHQETIQPPPLKPRNPQKATSATSHKSSSSSSTRRERTQASAAPVTASTTTTQRRPKISLHPNWYTENIYTNQSMDDSDGDSSINKRPLTTSASFSHYNTRSSHRHNQYRNSFHHYDFNGNNRTNNININISNTANTKLHGYASSFEDDGFDMDGAPYFERHRNYPKSHSCSFAERQRERTVIDARSRSVPKSQSFTGPNRSHLTQQCDMDLIEYQRYKRMMKTQRQQLSATAGYFGPQTSSQSTSHQHQHMSNEPPFVMRICDREGCFSDTCLVKNVNNSQNISINNNIINNNNINTSHIINEWDLRNKNSNFRDRNDGRRNLPPRDTFLDDIETFDDDDFIFNDGFSFQEFPCQPARPNQRYPRSNHNNPYFSSMCCATNFPDQFHRRSRVYDRDLHDLFRRERSKVLIRNKFEKLNKYSDEFTDDYQKSFEDLFHEGKGTVHGHNLKPSKTMLEVKPPNKYDDTESDSTDLDLDDFNVDFEKYWEELEDKNLSTSSTLELADENFDDNNNHVDSKSTDQDTNTESDANNNPIHFINDFYKPTKYSPLNSKRLDYFQKILPPKKINILSTARPLGLVTANDHAAIEYGASMKRPLTLSNIIESPVHDATTNHNAAFAYNPSDESMEHPKFEIIPKKTGLKISPLYNFEFDNCHNNIINNNSCKLKSTARPLIFW